MAVFLLAFLILAMAGHSSASWCVCKPVSDTILQAAIDYACAQGADCNPIKPNGQCYNPSSVRNHCSFAVNSYYQKRAASGATCDFNGAATLTNSDPSGGGCSFSATSSSGTTGGTTTVPSTTPTSGGTMTPTYGAGTGTGTGTGTSTGTGVGTGTGTGTGMPTGSTPVTGTSPYGSTPTGAGGTLGGVGTGLGPTASSMDDNHARVKLAPSSALLALVISATMWWWN